MEFTTIDGGLFQIVRRFSDESTLTEILWPVDGRARAVSSLWPMEEKQSRRKRRGRR
jgi:hypothetical protein